MRRAILLSCLFILASCGSDSESSNEEEYASEDEERGGETFS